MTKRAQVKPIAAQTRKDGSEGQIRVPQALELGLLRAGLTKAELGVALLIRFRQFQYAEDRGKPQAIRVEDIAHITGLRTRSVIRILTRLERRGLVTRHLGGGRGRPNTYALVVEAFVNPDPPVSLSQPRNPDPSVTVSDLNPDRPVPETLTGATPFSPETLTGATPFALIGTGAKALKESTKSTPRAHAREDGGQKDPDETDGPDLRPEAWKAIHARFREARAGVLNA